jgi:DNA polymerase
MLLGEAPGEQEERLGIPFVGASGQELDRMLAEAGWNPGEIYKTNVFKTRPLNNKLESIFVSQQEWKTLYGTTTTGAGSPAPYRIDNKIHFLPPSFQLELSHLAEEIAACNPNLILALGNTALWSLTGRQNISSLRGTVLLSTTLSTPRKLLPSWHPAAILRQWDLRPILIADLIKARRQAQFPEIRRPSRQVLVNPTLTDLEIWYARLLEDPPSSLAVDVETKRGQITEIGFARSSVNALVVPFIKSFNEHYWPTPGCEATALRGVKAILQTPIPKVFQNGLYDLQYIWRTWRLTPRNCLHDTMLKHHSLFPEVQKGLGFLGSLYTDEPAWKFMRARKATEGKLDDE